PIGGPSGNTGLSVGRHGISFLRICVWPLISAPFLLCFKMGALQLPEFLRQQGPHSCCPPPPPLHKPCSLLALMMLPSRVMRHLQENQQAQRPPRTPQFNPELRMFPSIDCHAALSPLFPSLQDFHSHLTKSEVVGYLAGQWNINSQLLTVLRAFPCRSRLGDGELAAIVEEEICQNLFLRGLSLVGWYHSHPFSHPLPSLQDIDMQMDYQLKLQGTSNSFQPCLALICGPYYHGNQGVESKISPFWVMPPPEVSRPWQSRGI
uniref:MPN domain containing n=1 Tax=Naja naja TaxID=35670 RepID=A0A8C6VC67_NAJNA